MSSKVRPSPYGVTQFPTVLQIWRTGAKMSIGMPKAFNRQMAKAFLGDNPFTERSEVYRIVYLFICYSSTIVRSEAPLYTLIEFFCSANSKKIVFAHGGIWFGVPPLLPDGCAREGLTCNRQCGMLMYVDDGTSFDDIRYGQRIGVDVDQCTGLLTTRVTTVPRNGEH